MRYTVQIADTRTNLYAWCGNNPVKRIDPSGQSWSDVINAGIALVTAIYQVIDNAINEIGGPVADNWNRVTDGLENTWDSFWSSGDSCYEAPAPLPPPTIVRVVATPTSHQSEYYPYALINEKPCYYCHSAIDVREPTGYSNHDYVEQYFLYGEVYDKGKLQLFKHKRYIDQAGFDQSSEDLTWATGELFFDLAGEGLPSLAKCRIPYMLSGYQLGTSLYKNATWPTETYYNKSPFPPW